MANPSDYQKALEDGEAKFWRLRIVGRFVQVDGREAGEARARLRGTSNRCPTT